MKHKKAKYGPFAKKLKSDVLILQQGCRIFRELVMKVTADADDEGEQINVDMKLGIDPFKKSTIAGAAMNIFRTLCMSEEPIAALQKPIAKKLKKGFVGGRTGCAMKYWKGKRAEYVDFTSLYPWVNKYGLYPVGHPEIKEDMIITSQSTIRQSLERTGLGDVGCPQNLHHPLLHEKRDSKLMFDSYEKETAIHELGATKSGRSRIQDNQCVLDISLG